VINIQIPHSSVILKVWMVHIWTGLLFLGDSSLNLVRIWFLVLTLTRGGSDWVFFLPEINNLIDYNGLFIVLNRYQLRDQPQSLWNEAWLNLIDNNDSKSLCFK
jgi:hypothetical protein